MSATASIQPNALKAAALEYAADGIPVFPLIPGDNKPVIAKNEGGQGFKDATTDPDQIAAWWKHWPYANIGIPTGDEFTRDGKDGEEGETRPASGWLAIDIDAKNNATYDDLLALCPPGHSLPPTRTAHTPTGGLHLIFRYPKNGPRISISESKLAPGIDVRAYGGYVAVAPSRRASGRYEWANDLEPAPCPSWLVKLLLEGPRPEPRMPSTAGAAPCHDRERKWLDEAIAKATDGSRNSTGFWLACQLRDNGRSEDAAKSVMLDYAASVAHLGKQLYTDKEALASLREAYSEPPREPAKARTTNHSGKQRQQKDEHQGHQEDAGAAGGNPDDQQGDEEQSKSGRGPSIAVQVIQLASNCEFFHDQEREAWVTFPVDGHKETTHVNAGAFWDWLEHQFHEETERTVNAAAKQEAQGVFRGKAKYGGGQQHTVHVRLAESDGTIYLDLADEARQVVKITPAGWEVVSDAPVKFWRPKGMLSLPVPTRGGKIDDLRPFVNIADEEWPLLVGFLVGACRPAEVGGHPILAIGGEQGSSKSTMARLIRLLVDPNRAPLRGEPSDRGDLMITAQRNRLLVFDNLSGTMHAWLSDSLCRISTGGGHAKRQLYTDSDEVIFDSTRPIVLTSIADVASKSDLVDRCIFLLLPRIKEEQRRNESTFWREFEQRHAGILGALLSAVSAAMKHLPTTDAKNLPRMADFATWVIAAEPALGWEAGSFLEAYRANRAAANKLALDASLVGTAMLDLIEPGGSWEGTSKELLAALDAKNPDNKKKPGWPGTARAISGAIREIAPNLRAVGFTIPEDTRKTKTGNVWKFTRLEIKETPPPPPPPGAPKPNANGSAQVDVGVDVDVEVDMSTPTSTPTNTETIWPDGTSGGGGRTNSFISNGHKPELNTSFGDRVAALVARGIRQDAAIAQVIRENEEAVHAPSRP